MIPASDSPHRGSRTIGLLCLLWLAALLFALTQGPRLGDHEIIVAQIARQMLASGDWIVPHFLDAPFLMKPPLTPWLIAAGGRLLPDDGPTGLPVTALAARLPSILASGLTIWIVFSLALTMFQRRAAWIAAFVYATALGTFLYAVNATSEALLTLFCTWAMAEFWWSQRAGSSSIRHMHMIRFYVALGLAMLAKGPMPLMVVATPLAVWWWCERSTRLFAGRGFGALPVAAGLGLRRAPRRLRQALATLGLGWGIPLLLLLFLPWMFMVAAREPFAWKLWSYEYIARAGGNYPGIRSGHYFYYIPIAFGLLAPWCLSLPEAWVSPFLKSYRHARKPLTFAWYWVTVGLVILSVMSFKKPYYILPLMPGCALLLAPALERFFFRPEAGVRKRQVVGVSALLAGLTLALLAGYFFARGKYADVFTGGIAWQSALCGAAIVAIAAMSGVFFVRQKRKSSLVSLGGGFVLVFVIVWSLLGPRLSNANAGTQLVAGLSEHGVPATAALYWASNRPDGGILFYDRRAVRHVLDPYALVANRTADQSADDLRAVVAGRIVALLDDPTPAYIVFQRSDYERFTALFHPAARLLLSVDRGKLGPDADDWIVATNVR